MAWRGPCPGRAQKALGAPTPQQVGRTLLTGTGPSSFVAPGRLPQRSLPGAAGTGRVSSRGPGQPGQPRRLSEPRCPRAGCTLPARVVGARVSPPQAGAPASSLLSVCVTLWNVRSLALCCQRPGAWSRGQEAGVGLPPAGRAQLPTAQLGPRAGCLGLLHPSFLISDAGTVVTVLSSHVAVRDG